MRNKLKELAQQLQKELSRLGFDIEFVQNSDIESVSVERSVSSIWINVIQTTKNKKEYNVGFSFSCGKELSLLRLWDEKNMQRALFNLEKCSSQNDVFQLIRKTGTLVI